MATTETTQTEATSLYSPDTDFYFGDCLDVMRSMPDGEVNLIITSPPYADRRKHTYGGIAPNEYVGWWMERATEMKRVLTDDGSLVLNIKEGCRDGERLTYVLELILAMRAAGWRWVEEYMWHKSTSMPGKWKNRFRDSWERLLHFTPHSDFKMNQDAVMLPAPEATTAEGRRELRQHGSHRSENQTNSGFGRNRAAWANRDWVYPSNVLHGSPVTKNTGHSAAYPEWLPEFFIRLFTDEGDVVLDPFLGSGTTYRVARRLGRIPLGIEIVADTQMTL